MISSFLTFFFLFSFSPLLFSIWCLTNPEVAVWQLSFGFSLVGASCFLALHHDYREPLRQALYSEPSHTMSMHSDRDHLCGPAVYYPHILQAIRCG